MGMTKCSTQILLGRKSMDELEADVRRIMMTDILPKPPWADAGRTFYLLAAPRSSWATLWEDAEDAQSPWLHNLQPATRGLAEATGCTVLAMEVVDSDVAICLLGHPGGEDDLLVRGLADDLDCEPGEGKGNLAFWRSLLGLSKQNAKALQKIWGKRYVCQEGRLFAIAELLGIDSEQMFPWPGEEEFPPDFDVRILRFGGRNGRGKLLRFPGADG